MNDKDEKYMEVDQSIHRSFIIEKQLGRGAYGVVWKVKSRSMDSFLALKKVFDAFRNQTDAQRTYREVCFLKEFQKHPNIITLVGTMKSCNKIDFYLIFEFMDSDLDKLIRRKILKECQKCFVVYQVLNGLAYIHSAGVIHRDIKPSNILVNSKCIAKIADFGLARSLTLLDSEKDAEKLTDYVATRWYRAPEILLANSTYEYSSDIWSFGCVMGEIFSGKPLFKGVCSINQLELIIEALPENEKSDIEEYYKTNSKSQATKFMNSNQEKNVFKQLPNETSELGKSLLAQLLKFHPKKRLVAKKALEHEYIAEYRNSLPELSMEYNLIPKYKEQKLSTEFYRNILSKGLESDEIGCDRIIEGKIQTKHKTSSKLAKAVERAIVINSLLEKTREASVQKEIALREKSTGLGDFPVIYEEPTKNNPSEVIYANEKAEDPAVDVIKNLSKPNKTSGLISKLANFFLTK